MKPKQNDGQYSLSETQERLGALLRGAFAGPPTPLKDIPKRDGESRRLSGQPKKRRKARRKASAPKSA
jgi:hypothetical protein